MKKLEKENSHLHKAIAKFEDTVNKFVKWICKKFGFGDEKELIKKFERDTNISLDVEKQVTKEERKRYFEIETVCKIF